ncbi:MAG: amidohydrolase family protein [Clostridia bacterium]
MIIDFHTHIFPEKIATTTIVKLEKMGGIPSFTDGTQNCLRASMKKAGISMSINLPVQTSVKQFEGINNFAQNLNEIANNFEQKIISFGAIHPDTPNPKAHLTELKNRGFLGIKIHPDYQQTFIDDERYYKILSACKDLDMIAVVHAGLDVGFPDMVHCTPKRAKAVIERVGGGKIVLAHLGGLSLWEDVEKYLIDADCYFDMGVIFGIIKKDMAREIIYNHGSDKILFGTDSPWCGQSKALEIFDTYDFSKDDKEKILYKNAKELLQI